MAEEWQAWAEEYQSGTEEYMGIEYGFILKINKVKIEKNCISCSRNIYF